MIRFASAAAAVAVALTGVTACAVATKTVTGTAGYQGTARDGNFVFTVGDVSRAAAVTAPHSAGFTITADGEFIIVAVTVENTGTQPATFNDAHQSLIDGTGRTFPADLSADICLNSELSARLGPAAATEFRIAFDVPPQTAPAKLVLRESPSSAGVVVALA